LEVGSRQGGVWLAAEKKKVYLYFIYKLQYKHEEVMKEIWRLYEYDFSIKFVE